MRTWTTRDIIEEDHHDDEGWEDVKWIQLDPDVHPQLVVWCPRCKEEYRKPVVPTAFLNDEREKVAFLVQQLKEAIELVEDVLPYKSEYLANKHKNPQDLELLKKALKRYEEGT
jgi:hypothetical protein